MIRSWSGNKIHGEIVDWSSFIVDEESCEKVTAIEEIVDCCHTERKALNQKTNYLSHLSFDSHFYEANECFRSHPFDDTELPSGFDANARHRNWLTEIQKIRKINQVECEKIKVAMTRKTEMQKKKILNRAKSKGKGGYLASTSATMNCQVPKLQFSAALADEENKALKTSEESEYLVRETRLKHKRILKQYIQNLLQKRQMKLTEAEDAKEKEKEKRKLLQDIVLSKGKHSARQKIDTDISATKTGPQNEQGSQEKEEAHENTLKCIKTHKIHNSHTTLEPHTVNKDSKQHLAIATKCHITQSEFETWKQKQNIPSNKKVFIISGWYPSIWQELINIGWAINDEKESIFFDFKFTLSSSEIDFKRVCSNQVVNHFKNSTCLTTKSGLISTLAKAPYLAFHNKNYLDFFPRAYDLSRYNDLVAFITDALLLKGQSSLSCLLLTENEPQSIKVNVGVLNNMTKFLQSHTKTCRNMPFSEGDNIQSSEGQIINLLQYLIIYNSEEWLFQTVDSLDFEDEFLNLLLSLFCVKQDDNFIKKWKAIKTSMLKCMNNLEELDEPLRFGINYTLEKCSTKTRQSYIDGDGSTENLWILKPSGKSRGRDIEVFFDLKGLLKHVLPSIKASKPNSFIVQKYIETPLTIEGHKFDIRQWVLVTSWNPVCIWLYDDCYIRFAVEQYKDTPEKAAKRNYKKTHEVDKGWVTNQFRHLVNNSIGKTSSKFHEPFMVELTGHVVNGYMWSLENFKVWLKKLTGEDKWETSLRTEIQNIVIDAILCAQEDILPGSQRAFEIYGFDIMMDQRLKPWLIEINSSPACDYSTPVSECFVKRALPDVLKVVIPDDWVSNKNYTKNTGGWKKIFEGPLIPKVPISHGLDMTLKGTPIQSHTSHTCSKLSHPPAPGKLRETPVNIIRKLKHNQKMDGHDQNNINTKQGGNKQIGPVVSYKSMHTRSIKTENDLNISINDDKCNKENIANVIQTTYNHSFLEKKKRKKRTVPFKPVLLNVALLENL